MSDQKLTPMQLRFIEAYTTNATEACRLAGYKGDDNALAVQGNANLRNPKILAAIKSRQEKANRPLIANREARQRFWSEVMHDEMEMMPNRLRASELLGKSEADFTDKLEVKDTGIAARLASARKRKEKA